MVTKRFVHLLTAEGQPVWKAAYEPKDAGLHPVRAYISWSRRGSLSSGMAPSYWASEQARWKLPTHVMWLARDQGVVKSADLPALASSDGPGPGTEKDWCAAVVPPALLAILPHF